MKYLIIFTLALKKEFKQICANNLSVLSIIMSDCDVHDTAAISSPDTLAFRYWTLFPKTMSVQLCNVYFGFSTDTEYGGHLNRRIFKI